MPDATTIRQSAERQIECLARRPDRGLLTCRTRARRVAGLRCEIEEGSWRLAADMPARLGGDETAPTPGVLGRAALASCLVIGIGIWAARLGIELHAVEVEVETDFDARGELGMSQVEPGYSMVRCRIHIDSPANRDEIDHLLARVERHSPYLDVFGRAIPISCSHLVKAAGDDPDGRASAATGSTLRVGSGGGLLRLGVAGPARAGPRSDAGVGQASAG